jgi:peptidase M1-like protein
MQGFRFPVFLFCCAVSASAWGQTPAPAQDPDSVWKTLLQPAMDPVKSAQVENVELVRDRIHIVLTNGTIQFTQPVNGIVFGAAFHGAGHLVADPPDSIEAQQLRLFTKQDKLDMTFNEATFTFTDGTFDEISKQVKWMSSGPAADLYSKREQEREELGASRVPRLFKAILSEDPSATPLFFADLKTKEKGWVQVTVDALRHEEVDVGRWVDVGVTKHFDVWMSFPAGQRTSAQAWDDPLLKSDFLIQRYNIATTVTGGADLTATGQVTIEQRRPGQRVLFFLLDSNLRVQSVANGQSQRLTFFQARERKDRPQSYGSYVAVVLPEPAKLGQVQTLEFHYGGKRAIRKAGNGNFFCESSGWYPEVSNSFATRSDFELTFHSPKKFTLVATGEKTSERTDGDTTITTWKSEIPLAVAGFGYGDYKVYSDKAGPISVDIYANREPDEVMESVQRYFESSRATQPVTPNRNPNSMVGTPEPPQAAVGNLSPSALAKTMGIEMANTIRLFESYFGPYPYKHLAVTSMPISYSYGQGWPGLIYLWSVSFLDSTQRHAIGIKDQVRVTDFFRAHESSHQWWGHRVGWKSYHDQWLSEGFAEFSGYLYTEFRDNLKEYFHRFQKARETLRRTDMNGHHIEALGPIWMGRRISSSETDGGAYQDLIYSKGGYVLHMLRMMLYDFRNQDHDHLFKDMMQDYCKTFDNKAASTEDFKAIVEKHMSRNMDLDGNHRMDWFFNQYVYGTGIPQYEFQYSTEATSDGKTKVKITVNRSGVPNTWKDMVPLYAHQGQGMIRLGFINATQPVTKVDIVLPSRPDKLSTNDFEDLLADIKQ